MRELQHGNSMDQRNVWQSANPRDMPPESNPYWPSPMPASYLPVSQRSRDPDRTDEIQPLMGEGMLYNGLQKQDGSRGVPTPRPGQIGFQDPRSGDDDKPVRAEIGITAFSYPGSETDWDKRCGSSFLGNFYDMGPGGLVITMPDPAWYNFLKCCGAVNGRFRNAEAAFHALKFWKQGKSEEFQNLDGDEARMKSTSLGSKVDTTHAGLGSDWQAMRMILRAKFCAGSDLATALLGTGPDFLLQYSCEEDDQQNELGLQLMLIRDELRRSESLTYACGPDANWTSFISKYINIQTGEPPTETQGEIWQACVRSAREALALYLLMQKAAPSDSLARQGQAYDDSNFLDNGALHNSFGAQAGRSCRSCTPVTNACPMQ